MRCANMGFHAVAEHDVEQVWHDFWVPILDDACLQDANWRGVYIPASAFEQIKRELYDYHQMQERYRKLMSIGEAR